MPPSDRILAAEFCGNATFALDAAQVGIAGVAPWGDRADDCARPGGVM
jgi:hypothetical protein